MTLTRDDFNYIRKLVRDCSAIVLETGKEYLVESRLVPLVHQEGFDSIESFVRALKRSRPNGLHTRVIEAMTTNETTFFRDVHPFEAVKIEVLPRIILNRASERSLVIWSAATSSGQEPYSVAMILREHFPQLDAWNVRIIATDISREMLARTREGIYTQLEISRGLPTPLLKKYFDRKDGEWQAKSALRQMIETREVNLARDWPALPVADIIFIRNVLIYFDVETKKTILGKVRGLLRPDGVMFMGAAETTFGIDDGFECVQHDKVNYFRLRQQET